MQLKALRIEGAIVMPAMKIEGDAYVFPKEHDRAYKYLLLWTAYRLPPKT